MKKISVILPVYNEESYLKQCLDSICNQTLKEIEIICIDDGSTDNSLSILRSYEKWDSRIKVLTQKNQFAGAARNYGMDSASGKYLLFLDSDDYFEPEMLEKLYQKAEDKQLDIAICHYDLYSDMKKEKLWVDFRKRDSYFPSNKSVFSGTELNHAGIFQAVIGWAWDKLFRTEFVKECGYRFPNFRSSEDGFFVYMLMARAERIGILEDRLAVHRVDNVNSLSCTQECSWENGFKMFEMIREELQCLNLYSHFEQSFVSEALNFQMWYLLSMHESTAFFNCYYYIREKTEPQFQLTRFHGKFLCDKSRVSLYYNLVELELEQFLFVLFQQIGEGLNRARLKGWIFPYHLIPQNSTLIIYGAGAIGRDYYMQLSQTGYCRTFRLVDKDYSNYGGKSFNVERPEIVTEAKFDYVLVSILDKRVQQDVKQWLQSMGVDKEKIKCIGEDSL